jgi:hypothetical protein
MAYYCVALVVDTQKVNKVELWVDSGQRQVLTLQNPKAIK